MSPAHPGTVATALAGHEELAVVAATTGPTNLVAHALCRDAEALHMYLTRRLTRSAITHIETAPLLRTYKAAATADALTSALAQVVPACPLRQRHHRQVTTSYQQLRRTAPNYAHRAVLLRGRGGTRLPQSLAASGSDVTAPGTWWKDQQSPEAGLGSAAAERPPAPACPAGWGSRRPWWCWRSWRQRGMRRGPAPFTGAIHNAPRPVCGVRACERR
jgi:hypothetical protein